MSLKQATRIPLPPPPDRAEPPEVQPETTSGGAVLMEWLKRFALYLGAVTLAGLVGLYFFWKIAALWNPVQLLNLADEPRPARAPGTSRTTYRCQACVSPAGASAGCTRGRPASCAW